MSRASVWFMAFLAAMLVIAPSVQAHVPRSVGENDRLGNAAIIEDPTKSWAVYDDIHHDGRAKYYRLDMRSGQRLVAGLFLPRNDGFLPGMAVMGPGLGNDGILPGFVEVPPGGGYVAVAGAIEGREYEPFTPSSYYQICSLDIAVNQSGAFYIAVFEANNSGDFGLAIGYVESFTFVEWLTIPFTVINVHLWEGQSPLLIFSPLAITMAALPAVAHVARRRGAAALSTVGSWLVAVAASLFVGTAMMAALQMAMALAVSSASSAAGGLLTAVFIALPLAAAILMMRLAISGGWTLGDRMKLAVLAILGFVFWAGLLAGPALAMAAAFLPSRMLGRNIRRPGKRDEPAATQAS